MKKLLTISLVAGLLATASAQNLEKTLTNGVSFVTAGATSNALSTAYLEVKNHEEVAVQWVQDFSNTNALAAGLTVTTTFGGSYVPSNFVAIATVTTAVPSTTGTLLSRNVGTNIYLGSYRYFSLISQTSSATNSTVTNRSVGGTPGQMTVQFKDKRNGY